MAIPKINLSPKEVNLELYSGDGVRFRLVVTDNDDAPVDITGEMKAQIRTRRGTEDTPQAEFTVDLTDAATGVAVLTLTGDQTHNLATVKDFNGFWDVQWTPSGEEPKTLVQGKVICEVDVTRAVV